MISFRRKGSFFNDLIQKNQPQYHTILGLILRFSISIHLCVFHRILNSISVPFSIDSAYPIHMGND